ncbi:NADH-quinone oxidoreductase subunit A [Aliarcobacter cryaerophilus]|uniref:NADH-quinone oxidoreductase subunit A n=1 Tax=Aliarcobacter cryaerophilus TaxID=28198 RepID=UPI0021CD0415|nr:NADH-quinone oxidoreductase subunit A [Aliarcobacter cryaerophilus]
MSFLLIDVEVIFMFPWAVNVVDLGVAGVFKMFIFMGLLFIGLIYIYKKMALSWD